MLRLREMTDVWQNMMLFVCTPIEPQLVVHLCPSLFTAKHSGSLANYSKPHVSEENTQK